jgi:L,D-transpeptidase ErfK/SrfK
MKILLRVSMVLLVGFVSISVVSLSSVANAVNKYNKDYFGETIIHNAVFEDTLIHLARKNGLGFVELRSANPTLDAWIPGAGAQIILPKQHLLPDAPRNGLVINLAEMRVYYFKDHNQPPQTYAISVGREGLETPTGSTKIVRKKDGPTWRPTKRMREEDPDLPMSVGPGPENPLGTHALYLGWPQYLMHGTNKPYGIGRRVSSGCMRMYPEDIVKLFPQVPVGTPVTVVDQPVKVGWIGESLYLEVSPSQDQSARIEEDAEVMPYHLTLEDMKRINDKAGAHKDKLNWSLIKDVVKRHSGVPVEIMNTQHGNPIFGAPALSNASAPSSIVSSKPALKRKSYQGDVYNVDPDMNIHLH